MQSVSETTEPTLATCLGETAHVSPLLRRILRLSDCARENVAEWLLKSAVQRGANHYTRDFSLSLPGDNPNLSDEEIAVGLCLGSHPYESANIRAAAQLLSSPATNPSRLLRLAALERTEPIFRYIADIAERFDNAAEPWATLRRELPPPLPRHTKNLPHWSRFVRQTGRTARGPGETEWIHRSRRMHE